MTPREGAPLLVAEAPAARDRRAAPLDGLAGDRLAGYAGLEGRGQLLAAFAAVNLLGRWPGRAGKGSAWPAERARRSAARLPLRSPAVVLLGRRVALAFAQSRWPWARGWADGECWGAWVRTPRGAWVTAIPHPSGVNRLYNDLAFRDLAGAALRQALLYADLARRI